MTTKRKIRKEFDTTKEYNVDVLGCTEEEKEVVQQAFFDVGIRWEFHGAEYKYIPAVCYTNMTVCGHVCNHLMYGSTTAECNMTAKEFLELVYEPEQQGHVHAELMAQYAEDAKTHDKPWKLWEYNTPNFRGYKTCFESIAFLTCNKYRRKPKTKLVNGVGIPVFEFIPVVGVKYYAADVGSPEFFVQGHMASRGSSFTERMIERGLIYPYTEEGKQAAILHAKAMLGIA